MVQTQEGRDESRGSLQPRCQISFQLWYVLFGFHKIFPILTFFSTKAPAYPGQTVRLSTSPLTEWHSFACVGTPETRKNNEFSTVLSRAGDWTSAQIAEPPKKIWVRGVPTYGALTVSSLFRRVVFVATGSGIGPIAPWLFEGKVPHRLLWTAPNVRATFGDKLVDDVLKASPDAVIYGIC